MICNTSFLNLSQLLNNIWAIIKPNFIIFYLDYALSSNAIRYLPTRRRVNSTFSNGHTACSVITDAYQYKYLQLFIMINLLIYVPLVWGQAPIQWGVWGGVMEWTPKLKKKKKNQNFTFFVSNQIYRISVKVKFDKSLELKKNCLLFLQKISMIRDHKIIEVELNLL